LQQALAKLGPGSGRESRECHATWSGNLTDASET
jgi:hypothetical protein